MMKYTSMIALAGVMAVGAVAQAQDAFWYRHPIPGISTAVGTETGNRSPVITGVTPGLTAQVGDVIAPFSTITVEDADGDILTTTVVINNIALGSFTSGSFVSEGGGIYRLSALPDATTAAIRSMMFMVAEDAVPAGATAALEFSISSQDESGASTSQTVSFVIEGPGNQDPVIANVPSGLSVDAEETIAPFSGITLSDPEDQILTVTVTLDVPEAGIFTTLAGFTDDGDGVYSFSGLPDDATIALGSMVFTPTEGRLDAGEDEEVEFTVVIKDVAGASASAIVDLAITKEEVVEGSLYAFGDNAVFQLGIADFWDGHLVTPTSLGEIDDWVTVSAGSLHSLAIRSNGTLWTWGDNYDGAMGTGVEWGSETPRQVGTQADWAKVYAGGHHSVGIKTNGTLWSWGTNTNGQLGVGDTNIRRTPTQVNGDTDWAEAALSLEHTVALKTNGTLWAWGRSYSTNPVQVGGDSNWIAIAAGPSHNLALKSDGSLHAWGSNTNGQLGLGHVNPVSVPTRIGTETGWTAVETSGFRTLALKSNGTMWAWGGNPVGGLGLGSVNMALVPTEIAPGTQWSKIALGYAHSFAQRSDGSLWGWGRNSSGGLGVSSGYLVNSPMLLPHGPWKLISPGDDFTIALK